MAGSRKAPRNVRIGMAVLTSVGVVLGCAHEGSYTWVDRVPKTMAAPDTSVNQIAPGDVISIRVFNQEANSVDRARVREDGRISIPFLNDVEVAGVEPSDLAQRLQVKLKTYIVNPVVTVVVNERRPLRVSVLGQVVKPGVYDLDPDAAGVVQALAAASGVTPFADKDGVYVLRNGYRTGHPEPARIRFRYDDLRRGIAPAATFRLRRGDVVVVE